MPIIHEVDQGSEAWERLRMGIPTSSNFNRIIKPDGGESTAWREYAYHLIAERYLKRPVNTYTSPEMQLGKDMEEQAVGYYELQEKVETFTVGFVTTDDQKVGCSPDRLVGNDGLLEIKCPLPNTQIKYMCTGKIERKYWPQLQGQLYVTGRKWVDICAYHEEMFDVTMRVERDEKYIKKLETYLAKFNAFVAGVSEKLESKRKGVHYDKR